MIKRVTTTAILLMVVAAVGLALLVTPAEAARTTTPPYSVGDRFHQSIEQTVNCKVESVVQGQPAGYLQTLWIACKSRGFTAKSTVWIDMTGGAWFVGDWWLQGRTKGGFQ